MTKILLGQLGSNGDCLYATTIARQIKHDFPRCHLTWAISSKCTNVLTHNPDVDAIWEIPLANWGDMTSVWTRFEAEAWTQYKRGMFDQVFLTQIAPNNFHNYDGTIRPSILRNYPKPITVDIETVIVLSDEEKQHVHDFAARHRLRDFRDVVLFECSSKSGQSFMTVELAVQMSRHLVEAHPDLMVVICTHEDVPGDHPRIISGQSLSMREIAELTFYATLFVGCGSGLTVVATSAAAKPNLPNIQILKRGASMYGSFRHDFDYYGKPSGHFLESTSQDGQYLTAIVETVLIEGMDQARRLHDDPPPLDFAMYLSMIDGSLLRRASYIDAALSLMTVAGRYGWNGELLNYACFTLEPFLEMDPSAAYPHRRVEIDTFRAQISAHGAGRSHLSDEARPRLR